jgi:hypothetical protein
MLAGLTTVHWYVHILQPHYDHKYEMSLGESTESTCSAAHILAVERLPISRAARDQGMDTHSQNFVTKLIKMLNCGSYTWWVLGEAGLASSTAVLSLWVAGISATDTRWNGTASSAPTIGPKIQIHRSADWPETAAGPRERAGLKEPEEKGDSTVSSRPKADPIAMGATLPALVRGLQTDSRMTYMAMKVPTTSAALSVAHDLTATKDNGCGRRHADLPKTLLDKYNKYEDLQVLLRALSGAATQSKHYTNQSAA